MATMRASVGGLVTPLPARVAAFKPVARVQRTSCVVEAMSKSQARILCARKSARGHDGEAWTKQAFDSHTSFEDPYV